MILPHSSIELCGYNVQVWNRFYKGWRHVYWSAGKDDAITHAVAIVRIAERVRVLHTRGSGDGTVIWPPRGTVDEWAPSGEPLTK
jgi:thioredoxin reductase